jgi:uncharacterized protein (DUF433 family)
MEQVLITRSEAAELSGASPTIVKKAVDQHVIPTIRINAQSLIDADDVAVLVMLAALAEFRLPAREKVRIRDWVREAPGAPELELSDALVVRKVEAAEEARRRAHRYAQLRDEWIVRDPETKRGEPVVRGSRMGVHTLAARIAAGESEAALAEDLPHIPAEAREVAVEYARANPRRGRPLRSA